LSSSWESIDMNADGMPYINAAVDELNECVTETLYTVQQFLKDTSFPLEDRWALYIKVEKLLPISSYLSDALHKLTDDVYDDIFPAGRGFKYNSDIDEGLVENYESWKDDDASDDDWKTRAKENSLKLWSKRDAWREAVLAEGISGFPFDW
jgi:hypothetical protein